MTIEEAMKKWKCQKTTVEKYIIKGYILGLEIKDNEFIIPDIDRPYIKRNPKTQTENSIDRRIKQALNNCGYVSAKILGIDNKRFEKRMIEMERVSTIRKKDLNLNDYSSTQNFILCSNERGIFKFSLCEDININVEQKNQIAETLQIGGINTALK